MPVNQKVLFITGVSSGIGFATADFYLKAGWFVIGTYRQPQDGEYFKTNFSKNFLGIEVDVTDFAKVDRIPEILKQNGITHIDALVNNAGIALAGPIEYQSFTEFQNIININLIAVFKMTQIILPLLKKSKIGARIVNISSVSGENGTPFLGGYCASKHAIEGFSESLRRELSLYGMKVLIVAPGSIKTPIWSKGFDVVAKAYDATEYGDSFRKFLAFASSEVDHALPVEAVVHDIHQALTNASPKFRYAPVPRKFRNWYLAKLFPLKLYDYLTCQALGLYKKETNEI